MISSDSDKSVIAMQHIVGGNVQRFRRASGLSQGELASRADCDEVFLTLIENGQTDIEIDMLVGLADALETEVYVLVDPDAAIKQAPELAV